MLVDGDGKEYKDGDVIDINQTVNGCQYFYIKTINPLDIYYCYYPNFKIGRSYEYDKKELLGNTDKMPWINEVKIIDHIV